MRDEDEADESIYDRLQLAKIRKAQQQQADGDLGDCECDERLDPVQIVVLAQFFGGVVGEVVPMSTQSVKDHCHVQTKPHRVCQLRQFHQSVFGHAQRLCHTAARKMVPSSHHRFLVIHVRVRSLRRTIDQEIPKISPSIARISEPRLLSPLGGGEVIAGSILSFRIELNWQPKLGSLTIRFHVDNVWASPVTRNITVQELYSQTTKRDWKSWVHEPSTKCKEGSELSASLTGGVRPPASSCRPERAANMLGGQHSTPIHSRAPWLFK